MTNQQEVLQLEKATLKIRLLLLELCTKESIHIGGDLSVVDMMTVLWQKIINYDPQNTKWENRDRFVLSKGHASAVTSFNQALLGCFSTQEVIDEYATDQGRFSMHSCNLVNPYVEVSTGSLGHGLPVACGIAAGLKLKGNHTSKVYVIMGDGEQSEGSIWEAVLNAAHYNLDNIIAIIDNNNMESDGPIDKITALGNLSEKYKAFGWDVFDTNGNDIKSILECFNAVTNSTSKQPKVIVSHSTKGKGVSFMENETKWHAGKITLEEYHTAKKELVSAFETKWGISYE